MRGLWIASHDRMFLEALHRLSDSGRESALGNRSPLFNVEPDEAFALVDHRLSVLIPVRMLARDHPEVFDKPIDRIRKINYLGSSINMHPLPSEIIRHDDHRCHWIPTDVENLGPFRVARHHDATLGIKTHRDQ